MRRLLKRLLAAVMAVIMTVSLLPATAMAALLDNDPEVNEEILAQLEQLCGSPEEAERYYDLLRQYNLLDEDGSIPESWSVRMDGRDITLEELRGVLAGDYDPEKLVLVDDTPITLENLGTILAIEDYIAYLHGTYFTGHQWSAEEQDALADLVNQIETSGIQMHAEGSWVNWPSGISHAARVSVSSINGVNFTANLAGAVAGQTVTFDWTAVSGSQPVSGGGTVSLTADAGGTATGSFTVTRGTVPTEGANPVRSTAELAYYVNMGNIKNALFTENGVDKTVLYMQFSTNGTLSSMPSGSFTVGGTLEAYNASSSSWSDYKNRDYTHTFTMDQKNALKWGVANQVEIKQTTHSDVSETGLKVNIGSDTYHFYEITFQAKSGETTWFGGTYGTTSDDKPYENNPGGSPYQITPEKIGDSIVFSGENKYQPANKIEGGWTQTGGEFTTEDFAVSAVFSDTQTRAAESFSVPAGAYYPGQVVPVTVTFGEPVAPDSATAVINGSRVGALDGGNGKSNVLTFPYIVKEADNADLRLTSVSASDGTNAIEEKTFDQTADGVVLQTPNPTAAFAGMTARVTDPQTDPKLEVSLRLSGNSDFTQWLGGDFENRDGVFTSKSLFVSIDGGTTKWPLIAQSESITGSTLTASIPLPVNTQEGTVSYVAELYMNGQPVIGRYVTAELSPAKFITEEDLSINLTVTDKNGGDYEYADSTQTIYLQDEPKITATYTLNGSGYSFAGEDQFVWSSSDPTVASIDQEGKVSPTGKAGSVSFTLTARNGGVAGKEVSVTTGALNFGAGLTPFLSIPNSALEAVSGQSVTVYWTSNLCDKNGETPTEFSVRVTRGGTEVHTATVSGTASNPAASAVIPASVLEYDYSGGGVNTVTVTVSAVYQGEAYSAQATIGLSSRPAVVRLDKLSSYYITDTQGPVPISWTIANFDRYSSTDADKLFQLLITRDGETVYQTSDPGNGSGSFSGSYTLENLGVTAGGDPASYRDVYTVTIQAKNGADSTWSYDSFLLYVYDADALKIWVDGEDRSGVTMSNVPAISQMSQADILALKRDINLKSIISVNYGEYAWSELADQIAWKSSDSRVASVNYQQGTLYENIENFSYVSYRPTTDFGLSGLTDGVSTVTATHKLTGMQDSLDVTVETLKDKLYLFQCYPQTETRLTYTNGAGQEKTVTSDSTGAAAVYEESGIASDVYCSAVKDEITYLGTFYLDALKTGEGDWTRLERYPCNNLQLRRAAFAYLYLKNPDGTPYTGQITFRGGVYVNDTYQQRAQFGFNGNSASNPGNTDSAVPLGADGKLEILMDQSQWDLPGGEFGSGNKISYVFEIAHSGTDYYPVFVQIDAGTNLGEFIGSGSAVINFRENTGSGKHPFIAAQTARNGEEGRPRSVLDSTGYVGPSDNYPAVFLTTDVMWWGVDTQGLTPDLRLVTGDNVAVADGPGEAEITHTAYPFSTDLLTTYTLRLDETVLQGVVDPGGVKNAALDYYRDGTVKSRHEELPFRLFNMTGQGKVENSSALSNSLKNMGSAVNVNAKTSMSFGDMFVQAALNLVSSEEGTGNETFQIQLSPTGDPTKFYGLVSVSVGELDGVSGDDMTGIAIKSDGMGDADFEYMPGLDELMVLVGKKTPLSYGMDQMSEVNKVFKRKGSLDHSFTVGGYMESLVYYDFNAGKWQIQILSGGFNGGVGLAYTWNWNTMCGPVPFTATLTIGGAAEVGMDALSVSYFNAEEQSFGIGNDFLTELRVELYLRFFGGVGFDYSVVAFKLGIFGQINLVMQFDWLNRPYMSGGSIVNVADGRSDGNLNGQHFRINGQIGLEFIVKFLFIEYEKVLYSFSFQLLDEETGQWTTIQDSWKKNSEASRQAIESLMENGSLTSYSMGGQQMLSLNLAPALEGRDYLAEGWRAWGSGGIELFSLDSQNGLANLESNTYPYANPVVSDDGQIVAYLSDMGSADTEVTRAAYAVKSGGSYTNRAAIDDGGYGDSQLSLSGTKDFAVSAWTRQMVTLEKDGGAVLTNDDQMMMLGGSEVCASVYSNGSWTTTRLTKNSSPDLAPVVAASGDRAIVAWRSVSTSGAPAGENGDTAPGVTNFDERDTIVYKIYENGSWGNTQTLYNGTSGNVKGLTAAMLADGTAAVAYTLDADRQDNTITDREIVYAIVGQDGQVLRNVRATNDAYLDENPQMTAVKFGGEQRFVLGWYTEQSAASDDASALDGGGDSSAGETVSDIRLLDFDNTGVTGQLLPDSISQAASAYDVSITSDFRFTKNSETISDLSILWVERAEALGEENQNTGVEKDVLKGVKFYTYGQNSELISFTGAVDVAEMGGATLIDHFDAYVSDPSANEIKAVILGTTYGADGAVTRTAETVGGDTVQYTAPSRTSAMYTATETYQDKIEVPDFLADYETVKRGAVTQLQFTVDNKGIHAISTLNIRVGDTTTEYKDLNLLPGGSIQLAADYQVPESGVVDPEYTVTATFDETMGASGTAETSERNGFFGLGAKAGSNVVTGTVYLDLPDVEITEAKIVREENGERTIQIKLNNHSDAVLTKDGRKVKISFYSDAACATPLEALPVVIVDSRDDLAMLDEGGYSKQVTFQVGDYVKNGEEVQEIPEGGVTVYLKAEVLDGEDKVQGEPSPQDNYAAVTCENLKTRTGRDVIITSDLETTDSGSKVTVSLQNTRLASTTTGNVIATLLDQDGAVLEQLQSYTGGNDGLISLNGEEKKTTSFQFSQQGSSVQITYSDLVLNSDNANLASLRFEGLPGVTLDSFVEDPQAPGTYRATVPADDLTSTTVIAVTESALAKARLADSDPGSNAISQTVALNPGETNTITITVTADNGTKKTYILTVQNGGDPVIDPIPSNPEAGEYSASVYYGSDDSATINLNVTSTGSYTLTYQWYSCDMAGDNTQPVQDAAASTLTVPKQLPGIYYYRCKVTRHTASGGTKDYWSSVASVEVKQGTGNSVTVTGTTVDFDNQPHGLTSVSAAVEGSTLYYSTDGGKTWSETAPAFTAAGVHTVWVKATAEGYAETSVVTADVVIREKSGTMFKLETRTLEEVFTGYPQAIQEKYGSASAMAAALKTEIAALGVSESNTAVYDIKLLFSLDGGSTWTEATADNFPAAGVTVTLPYPSGTNRTGYNFVLQHLIIDPLNTGKTAGEIETMDITLEDTGIRFTADCLSPFVLGWSARPSVEPEPPSYPVTVKEPEHGKVSVVPTQAAYGSTVTITAEPEQGYQVGAVTVTTQNGKILTVTKEGGGTYTFKMPYGAVSVAVTFASVSLPDIPDYIVPDDPEPPSDVPSSTAYSITVKAAEHGKAVVTPTRARYGSTVTVTATPDEGYQVGTVVATTQSGRTLTVTKRDGGTYIFQMPYGAVSVEITFVPAAPLDIGDSDCPSLAFADLKTGAWYHEAVDFVLRNALMGGYGNGLFGPDDTLTRAQFAQILYNKEGRPAVTGGSTFTDMAPGAWYAPAVTWAAERSIVGGYGDGLFGPDDKITREQLAVMLWRYSMSPAATSKELHFNDVDEISGYALDAIRWAVENGILNGKGGGILDPQGLATRAQTAQMLKNLIDR